MPFVHRLLCLVLIALLSVSPALAQQPHSPEGRWRVATGEAEFEAWLCGADDTALCARLTWLSKAASVPETTPYLGTTLVNEAMQVSPGLWAGLVSVAGETLSGSAMMTDADTMQVAGCAYIVACLGFTLNRL